MPLVSPVAAPWGTHDCRLEWNNTTSVILRRFGGKYLMINGVPCVIPAAGVVGTTPQTDANRLVWAYMNGATMALYFDVLDNAPVYDVYGMSVHPLDGRYTLVGVVWCQSGGIDGPRLVCSYWNRKWWTQTAAGNVSTTSLGTFVDLGVRIYWVGFSGDGYEVVISGSHMADMAIATNGSQINIDNQALPQNTHCTIPIASTYCPLGLRGSTSNLTYAGLHSVALFGDTYSSGSTITWFANLGLRAMV